MEGKGVTGAIVRPDVVTGWANARIGFPYGPYAKGVQCAPYARKKMSAEYSYSSAYLKAVCPVMRDKVLRCNGIYDGVKRCRFYNHTDDKPMRCYGPVQFVLSAFVDTGVIDMRIHDGVTPTDIIDSEHVLYRGSTKSLLGSLGIVCIVFDISPRTGQISKMGVFDGITDSVPSVIYVKNYAEGVVREPFVISDWSNWAYIGALYSDSKTEEILSKIRQYEVKYKDKIYLAEVDTGEYGVDLNVRRGATGNAPIATQLKNGDEVVVFGDTMARGWVRVACRPSSRLREDTIGYTIEKYLKKIHDGV